MIRFWKTKFHCEKNLNRLKVSFPMSDDTNHETVNIARNELYLEGIELDPAANAIVQELAEGTITLSEARERMAALSKRDGNRPVSR
jgi:hypothetical protein